MVSTSAGFLPAEAAASSMMGRDSATSVLRQSARCPGIHPSACRPVTASVLGPSAPIQIGGVGAAAGVSPVTWSNCSSAGCAPLSICPSPIPPPGGSRSSASAPSCATSTCATGISRATFAVAPANLDTLRVSEGLLAILLAGGIDPQAAAWATDSLTLYVNAYSLEISLVDQQRSRSDGSWVVSREELLRRFAALPGTFPHSKRYAAELTAGTGHDRFDFSIGLMIDGLAHR
jgi:hypothetical protein